MADIELSTDPADYITGPTGNRASAKNGGTNRSGGVTITDLDEETRTANREETSQR